MQITIEVGRIEETKVDTIIVNLFETVTHPEGATGAVDKATQGAIQEIITAGDFHGKRGEVAVIYPRGSIPAKRVLIVGLGKSEDINLEAVRKAAGTAIRRARDLGAKQVASIIHGSGVGGLDIEQAAEATILASILALYRYDAPKKAKEEQKDIENITIVEVDSNKAAKVEKAARTAEKIAAGVYLARDLVNMPGNIATPTRMAQTASEIANAYGINLIVGDRDWAAERKMGAFLAVAKGAGEPPKFIVLEHNADRKDLDTVVLVGKGITFDTGGISIKPVERMGLMKSDMAGAAAVLGAMKVVGSLNLPLRVIGIAPCTENMPDAYAYRPADVIEASNGKTIEIISTDAEGRMVLADGLVYATQYHPKAVIDLATLTGACVVALGQGVAAGCFSNDDVIKDKIIKSGMSTHERLWSLPLWDDYRKSIDSDVADMKNSGGRYGGVGTSAVFLKEFTDYSWAHLDIAGMALTEKAGEYTPIGATGFGVRLLVDILRNW
jgi:leucyl aminopeptidase